MKRLLMAGLAFMLAFIAVVPSVHAQDNTPTSTLYITPDGRFSVLLREGWSAAGDENGIQVVNRPEMLTDTALELQPGDLGFLVMAIGREDLAAVSMPADATLLQVGEFLLPFLLSGMGDTVTFGEVVEVEDGDKVYIRTTATDGTNDYVLHLFDNIAPGYMGVRIFTGLKGEFGEGEENEMLAIARSVQYSLELSQTHTSNDGSVSLAIPANYVASEYESTVHYIYDSEATLEAAEAEEDPTSGQARILAFVIDPAQMPSLDADTLKLVAAELASQIIEQSDNSPFFGDAVVLESEILTHDTVVMEGMSAVGEGGIVVVYNAEANVVAVVTYSGAFDEGERLLLTAINIANSMTASFTPAS